VIRLKEVSNDGAVGVEVRSLAGSVCRRRSCSRAAASSASLCWPGGSGTGPMEMPPPTWFDAAELPAIVELRTSRFPAWVSRIGEDRAPVAVGVVAGDRGVLDLRQPVLGHGDSRLRRGSRCLPAMVESLISNRLSRSRAPPRQHGRVPAQGGGVQRQHRPKGRRCCQSRHRPPWHCCG